MLSFQGQLVGEYHVCLWCKAQRFRDTQATQQHMVDKGHCKMLHESDNLIEYSDFYDYRSVFPMLSVWLYGVWISCSYNDGSELNVV